MTKDNPEREVKDLKDMRDLLPNENLNQLSILPDGKWKPAQRPLATGWAPPGRGHAEHGTDSDVKAEDYLPDQSGDVAPMQATYDKDRPEYSELAPPDPIYVAIVPAPEKSVVKSTSFVVVDDGTTQYSAATFSYISLYSFPPDPARVKITLKSQPNWYGSIANRADMYLYTVSNSGDQGRFSTFILSNTGSSGTNNIEILGNQGITVGIYVIAAFDPTKINSQCLSAIVETASTLDHNAMATK